MKNPRAARVVAVTGSLLCACAQAREPDSPAGEPYLRGPVEAFTHRATASSLLVQPGAGSGEACGISATVDSRTRYLRRSRGGEFHPALRGDISVGDTVEVYVEGPVAESCPVQGHASAVVLVSSR